MDSELVVKQMNGKYKIKDSNLSKLYGKIISKLKQSSMLLFMCP